ncbi:MAG: hypothetical protein QOE88_1386 [Verrucomicrobiota bacterium]|jgi:hypothetical protein|nr:hypothetical protein [Verrucomicrobiota bacterium]
MGGESGVFFEVALKIRAVCDDRVDSQVKTLSSGL